MQNRKFLIGGLIVVIIVLVGWWITNNSSSPEENGDDTALPSESARDVVLDFYTAWLSAAASTTVTPSAAELLGLDLISDDVRTYVANQTDTVVEPILCQRVTPERLRAQSVLETERTAQFQIFARGENLVPGEYALVDMVVENAAWKITTIGCYSGESAPEREFTFEQSGQILKSVPAPLDSSKWHLVFTENNEPRIVPMTFGPNTLCTNTDGGEAVCVPDQFTEAARVSVTGNMSESGVDVVRLELR